MSLPSGHVPSWAGETDRFSPPFPPASQNGSLHFPVWKCWLTTNCLCLFVDALCLQAALKQTSSPGAGWNKHSGQRWKVIRSQSVLLTTLNPSKNQRLNVFTHFWWSLIEVVFHKRTTAFCFFFRLPWTRSFTSLLPLLLCTVLEL